MKEMLEEKVEGKQESPTEEKSEERESEGAVAKPPTAEEYQKEMMADQPANRTQTPKTNAASDRKDLGE